MSIHVSNHNLLMFDRGMKNALRREVHVPWYMYDNLGISTSSPFNARRSGSDDDDDAAGIFLFKARGICTAELKSIILIRKFH